MAQAADLSFKGMPTTESVFSRLVVTNRCYRDVKAVIEKAKGEKPRGISARNEEVFELWTGTRTPDRTYTITRPGAPALQTTLKNLLVESDKSTKRIGDLLYHDHHFTLCRDEAALGTPGAEFAHTAGKGDGIDVFRTYLSQVPNSKDRRFAYTDYPITFYLNAYPVFKTYSDEQGYVEIPLPKGTQGQLTIRGVAFREGGERLLYQEWLPARSFKAKGGETVYRIPLLRNPDGW